jgi:hypothetical protein
MDNTARLWLITYGGSQFQACKLGAEKAPSKDAFASKFPPREIHREKASYKTRNEERANLQHENSATLDVLWFTNGVCESSFS